MARKFESHITARLNVDNWKEEVPAPASLDLDDIAPLLYDLGRLEKLGANAGRYLKEAVKARLDANDTFESTPDQSGTYFTIQVTEKSRAGTLDVARLIEDFGADVIESYRNPGITYAEVRVRREQS